MENPQAGILVVVEVGRVEAPGARRAVVRGREDHVVAADEAEDPARVALVDVQALARRHVPLAHRRVRAPRHHVRVVHCYARYVVRVAPCEKKNQQVRSS